MSPGFTLIEVSIVLGIVATLVILVFVGQGELRAKAHMTDAIDQTVVALSKAQNDAGTTFNDNPNQPGTGTNANQVFFGDLVEFVNTSNQLKITQLWRKDASCPPECVLTPEEVTTFDVPSGVYVDAPSQAVVFARNRLNGAPVTYLLNTNVAGVVDDFSYYDSHKQATGKTAIKFNDGNTHCANITITDTGFIDKEYLPAC